MRPSSSRDAENVRKLTEAERIIQKGLQQWRDVGTALELIRDQELWHPHYRSFTAYCSARWGLSKEEAARLRRNAALADHLDPGRTVFTSTRSVDQVAAAMGGTTSQVLRTLNEMTPAQLVEKRQQAEATIRDQAQAVDAEDLEEKIQKWLNRGRWLLAKTDDAHGLLEMLDQLAARLNASA